MKWEIEQFTDNETHTTSEIVGIVSLNDEEQYDDTTIVEKLADMGVLTENAQFEKFECESDHNDEGMVAIYVYQKTENGTDINHDIPVCILRRDEYL